MSKNTGDGELEALLQKLFEDLYSTYYHPTDIDACHLHKKHTPQCYGCRHAKWSNIIKSELQERFDSLNALQELKKYTAQEANKAQQKLLQELMEQKKEFESRIDDVPVYLHAVPVSVIQNKLEGLS